MLSARYSRCPRGVAAADMLGMLLTAHACVHVPQLVVAAFLEKRKAAFVAVGIPVVLTNKRSGALTSR